MTAHALDTLAIAGKLKAAGFSESQAEAMTFVLRDVNEAGMSYAATKANVRAVIAELRADLQAFKADMKTEFQSLRSDMGGLRTELKSDMKSLELRLEAKIEAGKAETIKWVVSAIGFQTIVLVGAVVALSRLFQP